MIFRLINCHVKRIHTSGGRGGHGNFLLSRHHLPHLSIPPPPHRLEKSSPFCSSRMRITREGIPK